VICILCVLFVAYCSIHRVNRPPGIGVPLYTTFMGVPSASNVPGIPSWPNAFEPCGGCLALNSGGSG